MTKRTIKSITFSSCKSRNIVFRADSGFCRHHMFNWCDKNDVHLKLLKLGAVVIRNTRRVRLLFSSACPDPALFTLVAARLQG